MHKKLVTAFRFDKVDLHCRSENEKDAGVSEVKYIKTVNISDDTVFMLMKFTFSLDRNKFF